MTDWFRSWHGAPTDPKWLAVAKRADVPAGVVSAVVWALFDHASQAEPRGSVDGFDSETYAAFSGFEAAQIDAVVLCLTDKGIIHEGMLSNWQKRQPKREDDSTQRVREWRERNRNDCNAEKQHRDRVDTEKNRAEKKDKKPRAESAQLFDGSEPKPEEPTARSELAKVLDPEHVAAVIEHRAAKRAKLTARAATMLARNFAKCPDPNAAVDTMLARGWTGFEPGWLQRSNGAAAPRGDPHPYAFTAPDYPPAYYDAHAKWAAAGRAGLMPRPEDFKRARTA